MIIRENFPIADVLWYKIGGTVKHYIEARSRNDILEAFEFIQKNKIKKWFVAGAGSNLLFTNEYYDGVLIQIVTPPNLSVQKVGANIVTAFAGETLENVIQVAFAAHLVGLEWAGGLPGTVGAAIRGNVGAFGGEIKDNFYEAEVLILDDRRFTIDTLNRRDIRFSYRSSTIKKNKNMIVLSATFRLEVADSSQLASARQTYYANIEYRKTRHPLEYPNTGSVFKNITEPENIARVLEVFPDISDMVATRWHGKVAMGYLIKRLELAGFQVGGAQISHKHSNFIVNLGGARFTDVLTIIQKVKQVFEGRFGFTPEVEIEIVT